MKNFKNFRLSTELTPVQQEMKDTYNIQFCEDDEGVDWYHRRGMFSPDTLKVVYDSQGYICMADVDASSLQNPIGLSVAEVDVQEVPADFSERFRDGIWQYENGEIIPCPVRQSAIAMRMREEEMTELSSRITTLAEAQDDGDISEDELAELMELRAKRSALRRLNLTSEPDVGQSS